MSNNTVLHEFLTILVELKVYHWNTESFARHKASDQCFADLNGLIDKYMEALLGQVSRGKVFARQPDLKISLTKPLSDKYMQERIQKLIGALTQKKLPNDLANLRDEMITVLHTTLYLFSLK